MKQKLISKLKRVALALFAALCVGSVWGAEIYTGGDPICTFDVQTKKLYFKRGFTPFEKGTYCIYCTYSYNNQSGEQISGEGRAQITATKTYWNDDNYWPSLTKEFVLSDFPVGGVLTASVAFQKQNGSEWVNCEEYGDSPIVLNYSFDTGGVLSSDCIWQVTPEKKFIISGQTSGGNIKSVRVRYVVGNSEYAELSNEAQSVDAEYDPTTGAYRAEIPFTENGIFLSYSVFAVYGDATEKIYTDAQSSDNVFSTQYKEKASCTYTWRGEGEDDIWTNFANWNMEGLGFGYPGLNYDNITGEYVAGTDGARSTVRFVGNAEIDLEGKAYEFYEQNDSTSAQNTPYRGLTFEKPDELDKMFVVLKNGTIGTKVPADRYGPLLLGAAGVELEFRNAEFKIRTASNYLRLNKDATIVFSGDEGRSKNQAWYFAPKSDMTNSRLVFRNFIGYTYYSAANTSIASGSVVEITNSVWKVRTGTSADSSASNGFAERVVFRDGDDRQAQLKCVAYYKVGNTTDDQWANINLNNTYDIKIPAAGHEDASIFAKNLTAGPTGTFEIDVTDYVTGERVPVVELMGTPAYTTLPKLVAKANGADVTDARNAKLVWDGNFMYYQQDSQNAASIGATEYATLGEAVEKAADGAAIKVLNNCTADTACVIANKTLTIDLNGKTVKANDTDAATDGNGVFWVQAGGVLTLEDSSEDKSGTVDGNGGNGYKMAIWADGGKVVINAGNYVNDNDGTHNQYDLIYAKNGGEIVINGGTFKCDTPRWTLNSHNTKPGTFVVTGGKFYQYNPTDFDTDEAVTTWCDAKYRAEADGDWYIIKEGYTVTEESAATVTADTEAEALAQVDFSVTTPDGVDATAYKNYFKLVATETAEGSKTWTVALALKDELKPVIAETTNDDGTVTPALTFEDGKVTVNIENELPGLYYGVRYATTVEAVDAAEIVPGFTVTPAEGDTAGFFKVVVDFKEIK